MVGMVVETELRLVIVAIKAFKVKMQAKLVEEANHQSEVEDDQETSKIRERVDPSFGLPCHYFGIWPRGYCKCTCHVWLL